MTEWHQIDTAPYNTPVLIAFGDTGTWYVNMAVYMLDKWHTYPITNDTYNIQPELWAHVPHPPKKGG